MAAPIGNRYWELRSKHGRDKLFESPELLWEAATEYFEWCSSNPWIRKEPLRGGERAGELIDVPVERPLTLKGLCTYLGCADSYFRVFKMSADEDFLTVIHAIEQIIYTQKFEGAAVGAFNANIIARDLGLAEKQELTGPDGQPLFKDKSDQELIEMANRLNKLANDAGGDN